MSCSYQNTLVPTKYSMLGVRLVWLAVMRASDIFSMAGHATWLAACPRYHSLPCPRRWEIPGGSCPFLFGASRAWGLGPGAWGASAGILAALRACPTLNLVAPEPLRHSLPLFQGTVSTLSQQLYLRKGPDHAYHD